MSTLVQIDHCLVAAAAWFFNGIAAWLCGGGFVCGLREKGGFEQRT